MESVDDSSDGEHGMLHDDQEDDDFEVQDSVPRIFDSSDEGISDFDDSLDNDSLLEELKLLFGKTIKRRSVQGKNKKIKIDRKMKKSPRAISRCSLSYFSTVIRSINEKQKLLIEPLGFEPLLKFVYSRYFAKWIAQKVDVINHDILAGGKRIPISPESIHKVVGIPLGGKDVLSDAEDAKSSFPLVSECATQLFFCHFTRCVEKISKFSYWSL